MNFIIKEGNINDIEKIIEVCKTIYENLEHKEWYSIDLMEYDKILKKLEDNAIIVKALYKDTLAGFLIAERHINPNSELAEEIPKDELSSSIEMDNAGVLPKYRGNHLQESLILKAESIMKERDASIKYSYATVHPDNTFTISKSIISKFVSSFNSRLATSSKLSPNSIAPPGKPY